MQSKITNRIAAQTGIPGLYAALAEELPLSDLQSLLLSVYRDRSRAVTEPEIMARAARSALVAPSSVDARLINVFDRVAFATAADFDALELSPASPLATNSALGGVDQNNILTTIRNVEVLGDSTPALALECARRRKDVAQRYSAPPTRLASSHRCVRLQPVDFPGFTPHFRLFALVSAGRDQGSSAFEIQHLSEHFRFYLNLFRGLNSEGFSFTSTVVEISDLTMTEPLLTAAGSSRDEVRQLVRGHLPGSSERFLAERNIVLPANVIDPMTELAGLAKQHRLEPQLARLALLKERVFDVLRAEYPEAEFRFNLARLEGLGYYTGLCLHIAPMAPDGVRYPAADGGFTDWTARLLQDNKERLLTSGIGTEFICKRYRTR